MGTFERWGLKDNPYTTEPIHEGTLDLFVARKQQRNLCKSALESKSIIVIEGNRGVGTTSMGNFVRFAKKQDRMSYSPDSEVPVSPGWNCEILLANVLSSLIWSLEKEKDKLGSNSDFQEIKRVTHQVRETFKNISLQLSILGTGGGGQVGKEAMVTTPPVYPLITLNQYLQQITRITKELGYKKGTIIQIDNLDLDTLLTSEQLRVFLNDIRDTLQIEGFNWLLVGDKGLRDFIASKVDRLDDIVTLEVLIEPLSLEEVFEVINRRIKKYSLQKEANSPLTDELIEALYKASNGRIRHIFGIATRLLHLTQDNSFIEEIDMQVAKTLLKKVVEDRMRQYNIASLAKRILFHLIDCIRNNPTKISEQLKVPRPSVSRSLLQLQKARLIFTEQEGRQHMYTPLPDVRIAYSK